MSKQVILWRNKTTLSTTATAYTGLGTGETWYSTAVDGKHPWGPAGNFSNLEVTVDAAPGVGKSRTFTLTINGSDTALTVTISGTNLTAQLTGVSVAVAAWDQVSLKATQSGTPAATNDVTMTVDFDGTNPGEQGYGFSSSEPIALTRTNRLFFGVDAQNWTTSNARDIAGVDGTVGGYGVCIDPTLSTGTWTFVIFKNGVEQNGSGGTVDTRLVFTSASPAQQEATFSLPVTAGDIMQLQAQETVAATSISATGVGVLFTATTPGEFMIGASGTNNIHQTNTTFSRISGGNEDTLTATESDADIKVGITPFTLANFRVVTNDVVTSLQFTLRKNAADTSITATVSGGLSATDLSHLEYIAPGDLIAVEIVPISSPASRTAGFVFAANAELAATGASTKLLHGKNGPGGATSTFGLARLIQQSSVNIFGAQ